MVAQSFCKALKVEKLMKVVGDKVFYRHVFKIALPILIQSTLTYMVGFVDNIMVGQIGTEALSGVAIVNQLHFVYFTCLVGIVAGGSVFGTQFYGNRDYGSFRETFKLRLLCCMVLSVIAIVVFLMLGKELIALFIYSQNGQTSAAATLFYGEKYLRILLLGFIPFAGAQVYTSTVKDMGETFTPMAASIAAVILNTILNYLLIFGNFNFPELGVEGAAVATVISRYIEFFIIFIAVHAGKKKFKCLTGAFQKFNTNTNLAGQMIKKSIPFMANETFWSIGTVIMLQCYSFRGIHVIAGLNIATSIYNIFTVIYMAIGGSAAIIIGQLLGAGKMEEAKASSNKLFFAAIIGSVCSGILLFMIAPVLPNVYNTSAAVRSLATQFMSVLAICLPMSCFTHVAFYTIRAGGRSVMTFLYDSLNLWIINIPLAFFLTRYTDLPILPIYFICQAAEIVKLIAGTVLIKKGVWLNNIIKVK